MLNKPTPEQTQALVDEIVKFRGPLLLSLHHVGVHEIVTKHFEQWLDQVFEPKPKSADALAALLMLERLEEKNPPRKQLLPPGAMLIGR